MSEPLEVIDSLPATRLEMFDVLCALEASGKDYVVSLRAATQIYNVDDGQFLLDPEKAPYRMCPGDFRIYAERIKEHALRVAQALTK
jgi:hypothetical protein